MKLPRSTQPYIRVKGAWKYLYRAVDSEGNTLDFMLSAKRDSKAAARFFRKVLTFQHTQTPRVINVDKNTAYPVAIETLKGDETSSVLDLLFSTKLITRTRSDL